MCHNKQENAVAVIDDEFYERQSILNFFFQKRDFHFCFKGYAHSYNCAVLPCYIAYTHTVLLPSNYNIGDRRLSAMQSIPKRHWKTRTRRRRSVNFFWNSFHVVALFFHCLTHFLFLFKFYIIFASHRICIAPLFVLLVTLATQVKKKFWFISRSPQIKVKFCCCCFIYIFGKKEET